MRRGVYAAQTVAARLWRQLVLSTRPDPNPAFARMLGGACWLDRTGAVVMIDDPQQLPQALAANHLHQASRYAEHYLYGDGPCSIASLASL